jgi:outer membrane lipoprotein carrier protein
MDYRRILVIVLVLSFNALLFSTDITEFYQQVHTKFESIKTLQADISQTNEFSQSKTKLLSSGKLFYKPGYLVLDYAKPSIQKLLIKGSVVQIYDKNSRTVVRTTDNQGISNPMQIVDHYWSSSHHELISDDSLSVRIRLIPSEEAQYQKIEVSFNRQTMLISELSLWDISKNKVKYRFLNMRTDIMIPASKWNFTPPKGVKVIQQ